MTTDIEELEARIDDLEGENYYLEDELFELRGPVRPIPNSTYVHDPKAYIRQFEQLNYLKEIPQ